jgi:hypothetical protein
LKRSRTIYVRRLRWTAGLYGPRDEDSSLGKRSGTLRLGKRIRTLRTLGRTVIVHG